MTPEQFRQLTVTDFHTYIEARNKYETARAKAWQQFWAAMVCNLMNATGNMKQPVAPRDLLGEEYLAEDLAKQAALLKRHRERKAKKKVGPCP